MGWVFLVGAIVFEVGGTLSLRMATHGRALWYLPVAVGYLSAFLLLALTLSAGIPLGVAYGIWAAVGVALTALAGRFLFKEPLTWLMSLGIVLIIGGVFLIELRV
jgi:small multidrug resistance pump